uniref:Uncharacterized protein n=1 Tax=Oryza brachyantha TaxID=4533 RepID=J3LUL6_ORYBR
MVLDADGRLQRLEALVLPVPLAPHVGAGVEAPPRRVRRRRGRRRPAGLGESGRRLVLVAVAAHVHPQVGVALEALAAHRAEVHVRREDLLLLDLHHLVGAPHREVLAVAIVAVAPIVLGVRVLAAAARGEVLGDGDELHDDAAELGGHDLRRRVRRRGDYAAEVADLLLQKCQVRQYRSHVAAGLLRICCFANMAALRRAAPIKIA